MISATYEDNRNYPDAVRIGVGAVIRYAGNVLLIKRSKEPDKGTWSIPGGMVELGETLTGACIREVREECSINVEIESCIGPAEKIIFDEEGRVKYHFVILHYQARYTGGTIRGGSDASECRWISLSHLADQDIAASLREFFIKYGIL